MVRYYLTQRGPAPGTFPAGAHEVRSYDNKQLVTDIGRPAWGWVEYAEPLTEKQIRDYELVYKMTEDDFIEMVRDWFFDNQEEMEELTIDQYVFEEGRWVAYAHDADCVYSLTDDGEGNIQINYVSNR